MLSLILNYNCSSKAQNIYSEKLSNQFQLLEIALNDAQSRNYLHCSRRLFSLTIGK